MYICSRGSNTDIKGRQCIFVYEVQILILKVGNVYLFGGSNTDNKCK